MLSFPPGYNGRDAFEKHPDELCGRTPALDQLTPLLAPHPRLQAVRLGPPDPHGKFILYWMQRSQRGEDNPALNLAIELGNALEVPVLAVFGLTADYPGAQRRHYRFLIDGLLDAARDLERRGVPLVVRSGRPDVIAVAMAEEVRAAVVIGDQNPLRIGTEWRARATRQLRVPFYLVDADVVVPTAHFPKEEYAARTLRPKIERLLADYLVPIPNPTARVRWSGPTPSGAVLDPSGLLDQLKVGGAAEVPANRGGSREALDRLRRFIRDRLPRYATDRNRPESEANSELSAHLHFGHISPITIALAVLDSGSPRECIDAYLEELIVRRELAINFVARNPAYDRLDGCPAWARQTLARHARDPRPFLYDAQQFEDARTHDPLWNAAQRQMVVTGRMHNYLRMYWAKKILEWTPDAATAFAIAVDLNDRYEMDGRDPNGYAGIAWAIGGKHDRPWPERPIFGTVRSMSDNGMTRKLDVNAYMQVNSHI